MINKAVFVFAPGENHLCYLDRVFQSIDKHISIDYGFCVLLPDENSSVCSKFPVKTKVISESDLKVCDSVYFREGRADIPAFATYAQLLIPKYFSEYSKILFMEVDQIVQKDLAKFWHQCFSEDIKLGAVRSRNSDGSFANPPELFRKVVPGGAYYNMGVVLVDTLFWNENSFTDRCFSECKIQKECHGDRFNFYAQGAMNNALHEYVTDLGFEYNVTGLGYKKDYDQETLKTAVILHWSGPRKPWELDGLYKEWYFSSYGRLSVLIDKSHIFVEYVLGKLRSFARRDG